jgi:hypothetical protein
VPRFTDEQILQSARVQAGMFVDQYFAQVPIALRAAIQAQPSKAYGRALATALFDTLIERLTEARDEIAAEFAEPTALGRIANDAQPAELSHEDRQDGLA